MYTFFSSSLYTPSLLPLISRPKHPAIFGSVEWLYSTRVMSIGVFRKQMGHCEVKTSTGPVDLAQAESLAVTMPQNPGYLNPLHSCTSLSVQQEPVMAEIV